MKKWKTFMFLNVKSVLLSMVALTLSATQVQANDLLKQCDINNNWHIDTRLDIKGKTWEDRIAWIKIIREENQCRRIYELAKNKQELAQEKLALVSLDEIIAKYQEEIAELDKKLNELKGRNQELKGRNQELKEEREKKRKRLIEQLKKLRNKVNNVK